MPTALPVGLKATVTVPGSSANLGPGFDTLGIALGIYDTVEVETIASGLEIEIFGEGADDLPRDSSHLVVKAINSGFEAAGRRGAGPARGVPQRDPAVSRAGLVRIGRRRRLSLPPTPWPKTRSTARR